MHRLLACLAITVSTTGLFADDIVKPKVAKPAPIVAAPKFQLSVQEQPQFPAQARPEASEPRVEKGLSIIAQAERKEFAANGPLAFEVVLKNETKNNMVLYAPERLGKSPKLVVANQKTGKQWTIAAKLVKAIGQTKLVKAGDSVKYTIVVAAQAAFRPVPRPQPRGLRLLKAPLPANAVRRPIVIAPAPALPCGSGACRAQLFLEFEAHPQQDRIRLAAPLWKGKVASKTFDFEVSKQAVQPPPPIRPPIVPIPGKVTKAQAIQIAQPIAEQALKNSYKPIAGIRPEHTGAWIDPKVTKPVAKQDKNKNWKVQWTHFPKGKGFGFNVTVQVNGGRGAAVTEVFTSYSPR